MNLHLQSLRFSTLLGSTSGKLCMKNMLGKKRGTREKKLGKKNHQFIMSPGSKLRKKKGFVCSQVSTSLKCFVSAVAGEKQRKGKLKLIQPYEHSMDMRWPSECHGERATIEKR